MACACSAADGRPWPNPVLDPGEIAFAWDNEAEIEILGNSRFFDAWRLPVGRHLNGPIRDRLTEAFREQGRAIPCELVRAELLRVWRSYAFPIEMEGLPTLYANVEPTDLSVAGLDIRDEGVRILAGMEAKVVVSDVKGPEGALPSTPANTALQNREGQINLAVPLALTYGTIREEALAALGSEPQVIATPAGEVSVIVKDLEVYPSGERIALGVSFSADLPGNPFDTQGVLWLSARPIVDAEGRQVRLEEIAMTRQLESPLWGALTAAFEEEIEAELARAVTYDLTADIARATQAIEAAAAQASVEGVRFTLGKPDLRQQIAALVPHEIGQGDIRIVNDGFDAPELCGLYELD